MKRYTFKKACGEKFDELDEMIRAAKRTNSNADVSELERAQIVLTYAENETEHSDSVNGLYAQEVFAQVKNLIAEYKAACAACVARYNAIMAGEIPYQF